LNYPLGTGVGPFAWKVERSKYKDEALDKLRLKIDPFPIKSENLSIYSPIQQTLSLQLLADKQLTGIFNRREIERLLSVSFFF